MALYVGENRATMFHGDNHPLSLYVGNRKISGYSLKKFSGKGRVELGTQPYNASLPSVTVHGEGKQDKLEGKNLCPGIVLNESYVSANGAISRNPGWTRTEKCAVVPGSTIVSSNSANIRHVNPVSYGKNGEYLGNLRGFNLNKPYVVPNDVFYIGISYKTLDIKWQQIEESSTPTPYTPYIDLGTAPLPILRALPDGSVRDEIDVVSGTVVRRIWEAKITDMSDIIQFAKTEQGNLLRIKEFYGIPNVEPVCNFYRGVRNSGKREDGTMYYNASINCCDFMDNSISSKDDGIEKFKALADAGTPVTVWYPLETPIIEHYPPSILRQHPGYTQLIQQGGELQAEIEAEGYIEDPTPELNGTKGGN